MELNSQQLNRNNKFLLVLICIAYLLDYADRMVISALLPQIKAEWGVSDEQLGMLTSIVSLFIALFVLPLSIIIDRWSRTRMAAIMVFFWSLSTLLSSFSGSFEQLLITRALTGIGESGYGPAAAALIAMLFSVKERAKFMGIWQAFAPLGAAVGFIVGGVVGMHYGWRQAMGLLAIPGMIAAIFLWFSKDYNTISISHNKGSGSAFKTIFVNYKDLLKIRTTWFLFAAFAMNIAVNASILTWYPSYINRYFHLDMKTSGTIAGILALLTLVGAPIGGIISDKWNRKRKGAHMLFSSVTSILAALLLLVSLLCVKFYLAMVIILLFGVVSVMYLAPTLASIQDVLPVSMRATGHGLSVVIVNLFGAFWAPVYVGYLSDKWGLDKAMLVLPIFAILAAIFFWLGKKYYVREALTDEGAEI